MEVNPALRQLLQGSPSRLDEVLHPQDWAGLKAGQRRVRLLPSETPWDLSLIALPEGWLAQFQPPNDLLRDFQHRAKNHLAVISSLLQLQSNLLADPLVKRAFADCQRRVQCLALLYDLGDPLDFAVHLSQLVNLLLEGREAPPLRLAEVNLSLDQAVPLSLIAHELIANSLRHAEGVGLTVELVRLSDGRVRFSVADAGPGLPPEVDPGAARSMGLRLVRTLARQLRAEVLWEKAACSLTFAP